jgi:signal transduction histidine kinase/RNase P/RNase MRP subunit p29
MLHELNARARASVLLFGFLLAMTVAGSASAQNFPILPNPPPRITNLLTLVRTVSSEAHSVRDILLEGTVCAATDPTIGTVVLQDDSGVALIELGDELPEFSAGDRIRIEGKCLLRRRGIGLGISPLPLVDNDGIHGSITNSGDITLTAGKHPLRLEWFNLLRGFSLDVAWNLPGASPQPIPSAALSRRLAPDASGETHFAPGLQVNAYEGNWLTTPYFAMLKPVKSGVVTNFDLDFRTRDPQVGLQFNGYIDVPSDGRYTFSTASDDGSLLYIGPSSVKITKLRSGPAPVPAMAIIGESMTNNAGQRWVSVEGRVNFVSPSDYGLELKLHSQGDSIRVHIADATGLDATRLMNSRVRVTGAGFGIFNLDQRIVLGELFAVSARSLQLPDVTPGAAPLLSAREVQSLPLEDASRNLPVHLRGVVTSLGAVFDRWFSIQDDTRGIFVGFPAISNGIPIPGEYYDVIGHSAAGDFAPIVVAESFRRLGRSDLPEPAHPSWHDLTIGSMDVQWSEIQGLVTDVKSNTLSMLLAGGQLDVQVDQYEARLAQFRKSVVRIQGVLFADWTSAHEIRVGSVRMRNTRITVDMPAPTDLFEAVVKTPRELMQFDAQATAFRRVKVPGQVLHAETNQIFLAQEGTGIRVLPTESKALNAGDEVEAVGYPDIAGTTLFLREAILRRTGHRDLPAPRILKATELTSEGLDSTRVRVQGTLLGWHAEQGVQVLEMQSGQNLYLARLPKGELLQYSLRTGSELALNGIYVGHGHNYRPGAEAESFEILLNYPEDVAVLSQPSWWTLRRMLIIVGLLLVVLMFAVIWITQLRRVVEQRTAQLQRETRERERVERQHALEAERSRIARDLHDDLGSSLTEINVLASTGQRPQADGASQVNLFHTIAGKARSLIAALDVIVWAVDPEDNLLQSLADYLTGYAEEFFSNTNIACRFKVPVSFPPVTLDGRVRHDLLLAVKEALNNIVRHAEATDVEFRMEVANGRLEIEITDNGKGFESGSEKGRHGLKNLSSRLLMLGGVCTVESRVAGGTVVTIGLPLSASASKLAPGPN